MPTYDAANEAGIWRRTTILAVRKGGKVVVAGDGQVSLGPTVMKSNARKVRRLAGGKVIAGFAGATADAFTLFERLEAKLETYPGNLTRAAVELAKDWRTDRYLRRLEAMLAVADAQVSLILSGTGDVVEPEDGMIGIGSDGNYALAGIGGSFVKFDIDGNILILGNFFDDNLRISKILQSNDGSYFMCGSTTAFSSIYPCLIK